MAKQKRGRKNKNKLDKYFLLTWKKTWMIIAGWFLAVILHNAFYALFNFEEAFFFIIAVIVIPIYVIIVLIYSLVRKLSKK